MGIIYAVLVLGFLIAFHEFGHFIFAKLFGVGVKTFSLGFGPKLLKRKIGETEYALSLLPLGGYVKMVGEEDEEDQNSEWVERPEKSFRAKHVGKRILIVLAGPLFNLLLGFILFAAVFMLYGIPVFTNNVGTVAKESPAEKAGMLSGDKIVAVDGAPVSSWDDLIKTLSKYQGENLVEVTVDRGGTLRTLKIRPKLIEGKNVFGEPVKKYVLGVTSTQPVLEKNTQKAVIQSTKITANVTALTTLSIWKMISGKISSDNIGGPILIAQVAGAAASVGFEALLMFAGIMSVSLFVMNILPIPTLDGGHLLFFCLEWIRGKPLLKTTQAKIQTIGVVALIALMSFAFYNDILRFFK